MAAFKRGERPFRMERLKTMQSDHLNYVVRQEGANYGTRFHRKRRNAPNRGQIRPRLPAGREETLQPQGSPPAGTGRSRNRVKGGRVQHRNQPESY